MTNAIKNHIEQSPIASWLGFTTSGDGDDRTYSLAFNEQHIGNPVIRALHGGAIASFLEFAAQCELLSSLSEGAPIKTVNVDIDYLASSRAQDMHARARILRTGRRIAFLEAEGWQDNEERPVAKARVRIRIGGEDEASG